MQKWSLLTYFFITCFILRIEKREKKDNKRECKKIEILCRGEKMSLSINAGSLFCS